LRYASALAEQSGGDLTVLAVNDPMLAAAAAAAIRDVWRLDDETRTELRRFVYRALGPLGAKAALDVVTGDPAEQIDKAAQQLNVDLVVVGTHGLSGPRKWFFGSTTESLFRLSSVPVLAVPAAAHGLARDQRRFPGTTWLAPIELEGTDQAEIRRVMAMADRLGTRVLFLHVVKPTQAPPWLAGKTGVIDREHIASAQARMRQLVGRSRSRSRIEVGDPVQQIEKVARKEKAAVIVMTLKRHGLRGPRRGSVTYRVVCSGVAAVLALPSPKGLIIARPIRRTSVEPHRSR
jgi:nucleotide-binding universal stress UspA family protein